MWCGSRALPFGWKWSPVIAQRTVSFLLAPLLALLPTVWIYLDDILLAHSDPHFLTFLTLFACHLLQHAGFVISSKSSLTPSSSILWLGKHIESPGGLRNTPARSACVLRAVLSLFTFRCTPRALQRALGCVQWLACPHSCAAPWLAPVYRHLFLGCSHHGFLPPRTLSFLLTAFLFTLIPARPRRVPPPFTMPPIFTDAAPWGKSFAVACLRPSSFATVVSVPSWVRSVQDAELYGVFLALRQCAHRGITHCCIHTDNLGVYFTLRDGRISGFLHSRARILRRIFRVCFAHELQFQISWLPSPRNAADAFSRPLENTALGALRAAELVQHLIPHCYFPTLTPGWLWFRASFPSLHGCQENFVS